MDKIYCIMGAVMYAHQGKLEDVINACATSISIIISLMMILIKMG